jgi:hypothetical protein
MRQRGRKSIVSAETVVIRGDFGKRPEPPEELTPEQAEIWRKTVASEAADYFVSAALKNMLADYCRHMASGLVLSGIIDGFKPEWLKAAEGAKRFHELLRMRESETRAAAMLATKLRLTNQSRYTPHAAATASRNAARGFKPWEE